MKREAQGFRDGSNSRRRVGSHRPRPRGHQADHEQAQGVRQIRHAGELQNVSRRVGTQRCTWKTHFNTPSLTRSKKNKSTKTMRNQK